MGLLASILKCSLHYLNLTKPSLQVTGQAKKKRRKEEEVEGLSTLLHKGFQRDQHAQSAASRLSLAIPLNSEVLHGHRIPLGVDSAEAQARMPPGSPVFHHERGVFLGSSGDHKKHGVFPSTTTTILGVTRIFHSITPKKAVVNECPPSK